ncbi:RHOMBOID-like protein 10, chloroplastic [Gossypium australe]|uniref:RHOMBOID-like protein 10, chloroplastic n=1 Tax=Gossypium australe TaxID=47621 RepID=A0A5B6V8G4_9ROSI|nr:RHOMBOID-like protein 10, chloroplastic [Gossypium australe]
MWEHMLKLSLKISTKIQKGTAKILLSTKVFRLLKGQFGFAKTLFFSGVGVVGLMASAVPRHHSCFSPSPGPPRVGSVAVFVTRYIGMIRDAKEDLQHSTNRRLHWRSRSLLVCRTCMEKAETSMNICKVEVNSNRINDLPENNRRDDGDFPSYFSDTSLTVQSSPPFLKYNLNYVQGGSSGIILASRLPICLRLVLQASSHINDFHN